MNAHIQPRRPWLALLGGVLLLGGCEDDSGATSKAAETSVSHAAVAAANPDSDSLTNAGPVIKRSERAPFAHSAGVADVVKLAESGAGQDVVRAFVESSSVAYELSLEEIVYLRDIGLPDEVIAAMLRRGTELRQQASDAAAVHTNLVTAVEQIREALRTEVTRPETNIPPGEAEIVAAEGEPTPPPTEPAEVTPAVAEEYAPAEAAPAEAPATVQNFYQYLSPYGSWYETPSYGWIWQPYAVYVNPAWRPYCHGGSWLWSDCGWYWNSSYSWGWAPFHYGRWTTYPGLGWCWLPDTCWGPSWVTWRYSGAYCGWAPLPPGCGWSAGLTWAGYGVGVGFGFGLNAACYTFVPTKDFCHSKVSACTIPSSQVDGVYKNSTVVNNIVTGNNNTIVNNGLGYNRVASLVRQEIPKARVRELPDQASRPLKAGHVERAKSGDIAYRPRELAPGDIPTRILPETRPVLTAGTPTTPPVRSSAATRLASTATPSSGAAVAASLTSRPTFKPAETRGTPMSTPTATSTPPGSGRARTPGIASRSTVSSPGAVGSRSYPTTAYPGGVAPKRTEPTAGMRSGGAASTATGVGVGPTRQTLPVPLADPNRNIPGRLRQPAPRTTATPAAKPSSDPRSTASTAARGTSARNFYSTPQNAGARPIPQQPAFSPPRNSRFTPSPVAPRTMPGPRSSVSQVPSRMAPARTPITTPSPSYSVPRAAYSAPRAVSPPRSPMATPSPMMSAPRSAPASAPARSFNTAPSRSMAPAPSAGSRSGGGRAPR